uniref:ATP citrate synthase n=1 Tax=Cannabis sativa TaxID=3483 RepID=A0A803Q4S2_CANSA
MYVGRETPSVAGIINPGAEGFQKLFFGQEEIAIPVHSTIEAACAAHPTADVFINFASFRSAAASSMSALKQPTIRVVAIIAEGVPESDAKQLIAYARSNNKVVIGPATVGGIQAGAFKIGDTAGTIDNIIQCKLYRPGSVGFVSKSGGMSNEMYNTIARVTDGIYEGIAIGGDVFPGSTLSDHVLRFNNIPQIKMMVVLGELGGRDEYSLVEALKQGKVNKPVVAWVSGTCARLFKSEVQFGHAGAKSGGELESAQAKNQALREAGAVVPTSFEAFEAVIKETFEKLAEEGKISPVKEIKPPQIPEDLNTAIKSGKVRAPTHIISTISDDRGEEPCYAGVPMSSIVEQGYGVGDVISLLWFKRSLPRYCTHFIEICIMLCADHGPCVSGAHNTIVTARAGKDLVSSLVSGLLTIGPRFGGAIDDAARYFKDAYDRGLTPYEFVESMKKKGIRVPGIGHRIKRGDNRDKRVELLQKFARTHFPSVKYMEYAVQVETYTLSKANNLVLNVDGAIGSLFLDLLAGSGMFTKQEIDEIVEIGYLNGLFVLARSIGLIGHTFDQKRLKQPLYRHPWEDVLYTNLRFAETVISAVSLVSGGMSNEMYNTIARVTDGIYEGIGMGGDVFPGSTQIKMMVVLGGELGGEDEHSLVEASKHWKRDKNEALREAGAVVPTSFEDFEALINVTFDKLVKSHVMLVFLYFLLLSKAMVAHNSILTEPHEFVEGMKKKGISSARTRAQMVPIGFLFLEVTKQEIDEIVDNGYLKGLFMLAQSIGLIG